MADERDELVAHLPTQVRFTTRNTLTQTVIPEGTVVRTVDGREYKTLRPATLPKMGEAQALYRSLGFREIGPYLTQPTPGAICFALSLSGSA